FAAKFRNLVCVGEIGDENRTRRMFNRGDDLLCKFLGQVFLLGWQPQWKSQPIDTLFAQHGCLSCIDDACYLYQTVHVRPTFLQRFWATLARKGSGAIEPSASWPRDQCTCGPF